MTFLPLAIIVIALTLIFLRFFYKRSGNKQIVKSLDKSGVKKQMTSEVNFCGECGTALDESEHFCGKCGTEIVNI